MLGGGGQTVNGGRTSVKETEESTVVDSNISTTTIWDTVSFDGNQETTDNPWGMTAGWFEMEGEGKCILLTPNTSVQLNDVDPNMTLSFDYEIHPWVKDKSDGVGVLVWVLDSEDSILFKEDISVNCQNEWQGYQLDISQYDGAAKVKLYCNNGENENDDGDWLIIKAGASF